MKRVVQIKDIGRILTGNTPSTSDAGNYNSNDILFVKPSDISDSGITKLTTAGNYISNHARKKARIAPKGSVITTCIGIIGKTAILEKECAFNQQINAIIPDETLVLSPYLAYAIYAQKKYMQGKANAAVVPIINKTDFGEIQIVLHDLSTQKGIITKLKRLDYFIRHSNTILAKLDTLVKSRFIEMFGDLYHNSMGWPIKSFTDCATIESNMIHDFTGYEDFPHIGIDSIEKNTGVLKGYRTVHEDGIISGKYLFTPQHIIYSKIRPNLNKVALPDFEGVCSADSYAILPKENVCNRFFLAYVMRSPMFLDYILPFSNRTNLPKVNRKQVEGFNLPAPPIALQNQFADFVQQVDKSKAVIQKLLEKQELLRAALMQEYFG